MVINELSPIAFSMLSGNKSYDRITGSRNTIHLIYRIITGTDLQTHSLTNIQSPTIT